MKHILFFTFLIIAITPVNAQTLTQEVNASSGGYYKQINGSIQFTIGEPLTETYSDSTAKLYQGFEQGSYIITSVTELPLIAGLDVNLYPNPSSGVFNFKIKSDFNTLFKVEVTDAQGKLILQKEINSNGLESIDLSNFAYSIYYVTVANTEKNYLKTFKIAKQ